MFFACVAVRGHLRRLGGSNLALGTKWGSSVTVSFRATNKSFTSQPLRTPNTTCLWGLSETIKHINTHQNIQKVFNEICKSECDTKKQITQNDERQYVMGHILFPKVKKLIKAFESEQLKNMTPRWSCDGVCLYQKSPFMLRAIYPHPARSGEPSLHVFQSGAAGEYLNQSSASGHELKTPSLTVSDIQH